MFFDISPLFAGFFIVEWAIRILMLFIVPRKQRTATVNAWLLLIMIVPTFGTIVYYMFGNPSMPKERRKKLQVVRSLTNKELSELQVSHSSYFAEIDEELPRSIAQLATKLGGLPPMHGNEVSFFSGYEAAIQEIARSIDEAEDYIHIQFFIAVLDDTTEVVFKAIENAVKRGVEVRFLYDKLLSRRFKGAKAMRRRLQEIGVRSEPMLPLNIIPGRGFTRPDLRNHRKLVVIDGRVAFTGSQNLISKTYGSKKAIQYEELVARLSGPVVWQLNNVFRSDWYAETGEPLLDVVEDRDMPEATGSTVAQVLPSGPDHDHDNNLKLYTALTHTAKESITIVVPYFIPNDSLLDALTTAAQRGVRVSIINSEIIDKIFAGHAQRSYYEELLGAGAEIYLYKKPTFLHAKLLIIDGSVTIFGSSNLDIRSFELDFELSTVLYDKYIAESLENITKQYIANSYELNLKNWLQRPLKDKLLDQFTRLAAAFL